jgi:hypothetical protein
MKTLLALVAFSATTLAWGQQTPACDPALCGASGLSAKALTSASQTGQPKPTSGMLATIRDNQRRTEQSPDAWNRHMPVRPDLESYDCILSFGVGGELNKKGFVGSRVGGQTQTWR